MKTLDLVAPILTVIAQILVGFFLLRYFATDFYLKSKTKSITKCKAQISNLKLRLKTRLKQKNNQLTQSISHDQTLIDLLMPKLNKITSIEFTQPDHYNQLLTDLVFMNKNLTEQSQLFTKQNGVSNTARADKIVIAADIVKDELSLLYQTDRNIVILIAEIYLIQNTIVQKSAELKKLSKFVSFKKPIFEEELPLEIQNIDQLLMLIEKDKQQSTVSGGDEAALAA